MAVFMAFVPICYYFLYENQSAEIVKQHRVISWYKISINHYYYNNVYVGRLHFSTFV